MKRFTAVLLAVLVCVPLLTMSAYAENMIMREVVPDELYPVGYITPNVPLIDTFVVLGQKSELWWYSPIHDGFFRIRFHGNVTINVLYTSRWSPVFSDPNSLEVSFYPCNGREVFSFIDGQEFEITIPASEMQWEIETKGTNDGYIYWIDWEYSDKNFPNYWTVTYDSQGRISRITPSSTDAEQWNWHHENQEIFIDSYSRGTIRGSMPSQVISLLIDDFAMKSIDYYIVQRQGSGISTSIDYITTFSTSVTGEFYVDGWYPQGYLVAAYTHYNNNAISYETGAYYHIDLSVGFINLYNAETLVPAQFNRPSNAIMNRFLTHFGYEPVFYSEAGNELSANITDAENILKQSEQMEKQIFDQAGDAFNQFNPSKVQIAENFTTAIIWINSQFMYLFNQLGNYSVLLVLPMAIGLVKVIMGRASDVLNVRDMAVKSRHDRQQSKHYVEMRDRGGGGSGA